jgi:acyl carrier protein
MSRLNILLKKVLNIPNGSATDDLSPETVPTWDSLNGLILISELEREFHISFTMQEVIGIKNVGAIKQTLAKHNVTDF